MGGLHGTYVGNNQVLVKPVWGGKLLLPGTDLSVMPDLVAHGLYDRPFTAYVQAHVKPGDTVIDVGANLGVFTILFAYQVWEFGRVIAYEANPANVKVLRRNVAMNWLGDRVEIVARAAAATRGRKSFLAPRRFTGSGSFQAPAHELVPDSAVDVIDRLEVDAEPLDVQLERLDRVDLVKIDVEGGEEQVFAGMERLLGAGVVRRISFELIRAHLGDDWHALASRLRGFEQQGWRFGLLPDSGLPDPTTVAAILERERVSQVLMTRPGEAGW